MNGDKSAIGMWNGGAYKTMAIPAPGTNWHHLAVVFDGGNLTFYWDGIARGTVFQILGITGGTVGTQLGSSASGSTSEGWIGTLDEVAFYADALTPESVQAHYQAFFAGTPPVIVSPPRGGTYLAGVPLQLTVKATGPSLAYQWFKGSSPLAGKTESTLAFASLAAGDAGTYSVTVTNPAGSAPSNPVTVALASSLPEPLRNYQSAVSNETSLISFYTFDRLSAEDVVGVNEGSLAGTAGFGSGIGGGAAQGLQLDGLGQVNLGFVPAFDFPSGVGTVEAWIRADWTAMAGFPCMIGDRDGATTWSIHLSSDKNTLTFYNGARSEGFAVPGGGAGTNWHHVAVIVNSGTVTYCWDGVVIDTRSVAPSANSVSVQFGSSSSTPTSEGWVGMLDEIAFYSEALPLASIQAHFNTYYAGSRPAITVQPVGGTWLAGQSGQISVQASGSALSYQWYRNNVGIPGATNSVLPTPNLTVGDSGAYYVSVSNVYGSTNSVTVTVQVGNNIARYQSTILAESGLLSYYTFDSGDGRDAGNVHNGTVANVVSYGSGPGGVTNQALILDGSGHIDLGQVQDFEFVSGAGTVEAWVRADWSSASYDPCLFADRSGASVWSIHMERGKASVGNWNGGRFQTAPVVNANGWHHYAVAFGAGKVSMFWDGLLMGTFPQAINLNSGKTTQIGSSAPTSTAEGWIGGLDEVAFYSATLSAETIAQHFLAMVGPASAPKLSYQFSGNQLTLWWPADALGFSLESCGNLPAGAWSPVSGVVNNQVTVPMTTERQFYRLRK